MTNLNEIMAEFRVEIEETVAESVEKFPMEESQKKNGGEEEGRSWKGKKKEDRGR